MNPCTVVVLFASISTASAIVCLPSFCDGVKQEPLNCAGSVIKGGGFCGCTDVCAKQTGEECGHMGLTASYGHCEEGSSCVQKGVMMFGMGVCQAGGSTAKRSIIPQTACQRDRIHKLMMNIIYNGQWIPKCELDGSYSAHQCDNQGVCFCVNTEGKINESTRVKGVANC